MCRGRHRLDRGEDYNTWTEWGATHRHGFTVSLKDLHIVWLRGEEWQTKVRSFEMDLLESFAAKDAEEVEACRDVCVSWRASEFEMGVLAANRFDRKILIDAVPGMSPWIHLGDFLSRSC